MTQKIDINKKYRTKSGLEVVLYTTDGLNKKFPVVGEIRFENGDAYAAMWDSVGRKFGTIDSGMELVEVKPRIKRTVWVNLYTTQQSDCVHPSKEEADHRASNGRRACVKVEIDCEEREGL
jgi:hypothetical protein